MNGWIETTVDLIDRELSELGVAQNGDPGALRIRISDISAFRYSPPDDDNDRERTTVYLKCGETFCVNMTYREFCEAVCL